MVVVFIDFDDTLTVSDKRSRHKSLVEELIEEAKNHTRLLPFLEDFLNNPPELKRSSILWNETIDYLYQSGTSESEILHIREKLNKKILEHERREHDHCKLAEDTELMLRELKTIGYRLVILTNTSRSELDRLLLKHHIAHYFDDSITRNEVLKLKPDPEGILIIMQKFEEMEFVIVDDLDFGVFAARNAGAGLYWSRHFGE